MDFHRFGLGVEPLQFLLKFKEETGRTRQEEAELARKKAELEELEKKLKDLEKIAELDQSLIAHLGNRR